MRNFEQSSETPLHLLPLWQLAQIGHLDPRALNQAAYTWLVQRYNSQAIHQDSFAVAKQIMKNVSGRYSEHSAAGYFYRMVLATLDGFSTQAGVREDALRSEAALSAFLEAPIQAREYLAALMPSWPNDEAVEQAVATLPGLSEPRRNLCIQILFSLRYFTATLDEQRAAQPLVGLLVRDMFQAGLLQGVDTERLVPTQAELDHAEKVVAYVGQPLSTPITDAFGFRLFSFPTWDRVRHNLSGYLDLPNVSADVCWPFVTVLEELQYILQLTKVDQGTYEAFLPDDEESHWTRVQTIHTQAQQLLERITHEFPFRINEAGQLELVESA